MKVSIRNFYFLTLISLLGASVVSGADEGATAPSHSPPAQSDQSPKRGPASVPGSPVSSDSARMTHPFGFYVDLLGDPAPSLWGVNLAYNLFDFMRVNASYGQAVSVTLGSFSASMFSVGAGAKFMVPKWNFTPVVGLNWTQATVSVSGSTSIWGLSQSGSLACFGTNIGFDYLASSGFNFGAGVTILFAGISAGLPYLNLGWFF